MASQRKPFENFLKRILNTQTKVLNKTFPIAVDFNQFLLDYNRCHEDFANLLYQNSKIATVKKPTRTKRKIN